jgi:hypothetical protein
MFGELQKLGSNEEGAKESNALSQGSKPSKRAKITSLQPAQGVRPPQGIFSYPVY